MGDKTNKKAGKAKEVEELTLSEIQAKALAKVIDDVNGIDSDTDTDDEAIDKVKAKEPETTFIEAKVAEVVTSDLLILSQEVAKLTGNLATVNAEKQALEVKLASGAAKLIKLQGDTDLLKQAASHACKIYAMQLGKSNLNTSTEDINVLANTFVTLRKEYLNTYPEGQNSKNPTDTDNSPSKQSASIHPISTAKSSR
jgi:hypothetical protein